MGFEAYRHTWNNSDLAEIRFSTTMNARNRSNGLKN